MKTLIVKYLPSGEKSNTKALLDLFLKHTKTQNIEVLDLLQKPAPMHNLESMAAYYKRNYNGQNLDSKEAQSLAAQDALTKQFLENDVIVMAYPMHNFGMPAAVKAYLDAVVMKGVTFDYGKKMMAGKKSLTIFTSGGAYSNNLVNLEYPNWDTLSMCAKINFNFMGFDEAQVIAESLRDESKRESTLKNVEEKIVEIVKKWY